MELFYSAIRYAKASLHFAPKKLPGNIEIAKHERIVSLILGETKVHYC